jgi:hypothetical protein
MRNIFTIFILISFFGLNAYGQEGYWRGGLLLPNGKTLPIGIGLTNNNGQWSGYLDSPEQNVYDMTWDSVGIENGDIFLRLQPQGTASNAFLKGKWNSDLNVIDALWIQGATLNVHFLKGEPYREKPKPQTPKPPFAYKIEEVKIENVAAKLSLAGTLTLPEKGQNFPAIVLIAGSGPQNRDCEIFGHKLFWIMADYFTKRGFAVLRLDDRGVGESTGDFSTATTADLATDIAAAFDFLQKDARLDKKRIGLLGHSEGGIIAPMLAAKNKKIAFVVLMAAPAVSIVELMIQQNKRIAELDGMPAEALEKNLKILAKIYAEINNPKNKNKTGDDIFALIEKDLDSDSPELAESVKKQINFFIDSKWFNYFLKIDPKSYLSRLTCPTLALQGGKDVQVTPEDNLAAMQTNLEKAKNKNFSCQLFPELNHLFQTANTGSPEEYAKIEETIAPEVLKVIGDWLEKEVSNK